ncbi:MAG: ABC transporter permease [Solirubrobacteraceae bacterium]|nr:ABC transporter permease [Solirubrobacteraceae bacterium]
MPDTPTTTRTPAERRRHLSDLATRAVGGVVVTAAAVFLLAPALLTIVLSFSGDDRFNWPPESWGLRQYETLLESTDWLDAIWLSIRIALPVALLSALIAVPAVIAISRSRLPGRALLQAAGVVALIIPVSAFAVAVYGVFVQLKLIGTYVGLVLANTVLAFPLALVVTAAAMSRVPVELELAAMTAGAGRARAWAGITLRLLAPAILAGCVLSFITSFDEAVLINFLGGSGQVTLPKAIFDSVRFGVDPVITAIATLLMVATSLLMLIALRLRRSGR